MSNPKSPFSTGYRLGAAFILVALFLYLVFSLLVGRGNNYGEGGDARFEMMQVTTLVYWIAFVLGTLGWAFVVVTFSHQVKFGADEARRLAGESLPPS
jgi:hypothetical protein